MHVDLLCVSVVLQEIINAAKNISTPIVTVKLESDMDVKAARIIKARIEKTSLGEVRPVPHSVLQTGSRCLVLMSVLRI